MTQKSVGDGLDELAGGLAVGLIGAALFLSLAQCGAADKNSSARRYEACMRATASVKECGKP